MLLAGLVPAGEIEADGVGHCFGGAVAPGRARLLAWYASRQGATEYGYEPAVPGAESPFADGGLDASGWWRQPLGAKLRGTL